MAFAACIAPSFWDIFFTNALRNGLLPVRLDGKEVATLRRTAFDAPRTPFTIDLVRQTVSTPLAETLQFAIDPFSKACLVQGMDDIAFTAQYRTEIETFIQRYGAQHSWLHQSRGATLE